MIPFCQITGCYKNNRVMFCLNTTLFLKVKNSHVFRVAKEAQAAHVENEEENLQLQLMICDLKLTDVVLYNVVCVKTCTEYAGSGILRQNIIVLFL
jgi:hypothetical protein